MRRDNALFPRGAVARGSMDGTIRSCRLFPSLMLGLAAGTILFPTLVFAAEVEKDSDRPEIENETGDERALKSNDLFDLTLEELLALEVTSVAKKSRQVVDTAAAVSVITQDDIRRSSARSIPDLLRMVPGMEIAEVQTSATSVSARGFTSRFAANLLVMVDGAAIYSTSISGMFWDQALVPLQDIERIEVIRGPGGALWGSNAISGIVNIITKQSVDTQGLSANMSAGSFDMRSELSYGQQISPNLAVRAYGDFRRIDGLDSISGPNEDDSWKGGLGGIRLDYAPASDQTLIVLAELSAGKFGEHVIRADFDPTTPATSMVHQVNTFSSRHALARWNEEVSADFDYSLQGYLNQLQRTEFEAKIDRQLLDLSFEGRWRHNGIHELNFGVSRRVSRDRIVSSPALFIPDGSHTDRWWTGYLQDDITLVPDTFRLTVGTKIESNNFTGVEVQPSARLFYRFAPTLAAWASVTRGVRTPLLLQREMTSTVDSQVGPPDAPFAVPLLSRFHGNPDSKAESAVSIEAGVRGTILQDWSYDLAAFIADYSRLTTARPYSYSPVFLPGTTSPIGAEADALIANEGSGKSHGLEVHAVGPVADWWDLELSYSYLHLRTISASGSYVLADSGPSSRHQVRIASTWQISDRIGFQNDLHFVSRSADGFRKGYVKGDFRGTWRVSPVLEISAIGRNLFRKRQLEYFQRVLPLRPVYVPRTFVVETRTRL